MIKYLMIMLTTLCNMKCKYCYRDESQGITMDISILEKALHLVDGKSRTHVQITGGEPTLFPHLVEYACSLLRKRSPDVSIGIQTNATLLDKGLVRILKKYDVHIGISMDGVGPLHDQLRGHFNRVMKGIFLLRDMEKEFTITTTLTHINILHLDELILLLSSHPNAKGMALDMLVVKKRAREANIYLPSPEDTARGIGALMRGLCWIRTFRDFSLREEERLFSSNPLYFCEAAAGQGICVYPDGSIYPCSQLAGERNFYLGDIDNFDPEYSKRLLSPYALINERCAQCEIKGICPGDCPSRIYYNQGRDKEVVCTMYRTIFRYKGRRRCVGP